MFPALLFWAQSEKPVENIILCEKPKSSVLNTRKHCNDRMRIVYY